MKRQSLGLLKPIVWRRLRPTTEIVAVTAIFLLGAIDVLFLFLLAPCLIYRIVGFRETDRKDVRKACLAPSLLLLPFLLVLWLRTCGAASYLLIAVGHNEFAGAYLFPNVIELGVYEHDPAGLKYLEQGVTPEIADVMTDTVQRFQTFPGSDRVYDCFCLAPFYARYIPVIKGSLACGSIYSTLHDGWTPASFYVHSGRWTNYMAYASVHIGFHFVVPCLLSCLFFVPRLLHWRRHERRLRMGCCVKCGYDLRGNTSGVCPECGTMIVDLDAAGRG